MPAWQVRTGSPKSKLVLVLLAFSADAPPGTFEIVPTITGIAEATGLSDLEVKLALNHLLDLDLISGSGIRGAGYDDPLDITLAGGLTRSGSRIPFGPRSG